MTVTQAEDHPRPQLTRDRWIDLGGPWGFAYDDADVGLRLGWMLTAEPFDRTIVVPYPPESASSGIGDPSFHPVVWYRRPFQVATQDRQGRLLLHFGAVDYRAQVWVNGQLVVEHEGGHTPFSADITEALEAGDGRQVLVVRAEDWPGDLAQPRGKQVWELEPQGIWYHRTTGIWQPVWLEPVAPDRLAWIRWTPDLDRGLLGVRVGLAAQPERALTLRLRLTLRGEPLADDTYRVAEPELSRAVSIDRGGTPIHREKLLWSPERPNLIDAELTLMDGSQVVDRVGSYAGMRSVGFADGRFLLNGRPRYPRMVLEQGYWPESHLASPGGRALRREVELIKELGFTGVRIHQKVEDPRFLGWCDRLGLLVWGEMANAFVFTPTAVTRLTREWIEVLERDYSHPSIAAWLPLNESWGVNALQRDPAQQSFVRALYHLTRALDPTRPVIGNDGWEHVASDVWGIHDYTLDSATIRERYATREAVERTLREIQPQDHPLAVPDYQHFAEPVMLTECGGITDAPTPGKPWYGYGWADGAEALLARYQELIGTILECPGIVGFCYTQLTDTEQETNGLLRADRTPKVDPAAIRSVNLRPAKAVPREQLEAIQRAAAAIVRR